MTLSPDANGNVEVAVLNLPPFVPPSSPFMGTPDPGKHFEMYYEVAQTPIAAVGAARPESGRRARRAVSIPKWTGRPSIRRLRSGPTFSTPFG